jgi:hypothetical protein
MECLFQTLEATMAAESSMHFYLNWAKERIDEMDATLASFEAKASQMQPDAKAKVERLVADLKKRRDEFQDVLKQQAEAGEAAWERAKAQLESLWNRFEADVKTYLESAGKQIEQQQATFRNVAAAQMKAWQEAADTFQGAATKLAANRRADVEAVIKRMKADASEVEARLQKMKEAGKESWAALSAALGESRKAFDRANQSAYDALKRAAGPHA